MEKSRLIKVVVAWFNNTAERVVIRCKRGEIFEKDAGIIRIKKDQGIEGIWYNPHEETIYFNAGAMKKDFANLNDQQMQTMAVIGFLLADQVLPEI